MAHRAFAFSVVGSFEKVKQTRRCRRRRRRRRRRRLSHSLSLSLSLPLSTKTVPESDLCWFI